MAPTSIVPTRYRRRILAALAAATATVGSGIAAAPGHATNAGTPGLIAVETQTCASARLCLPGSRRPIALNPADGSTTRLDRAGTRLREPQYSPDGTRLIGIDARSGVMTATDASGANPQTSFLGNSYKPTSATWGIYGLPAFVQSGQLWEANYLDGTRIEPTYFGEEGTLERVHGTAFANGNALVAVETRASFEPYPSRGAIFPWAEGLPVVATFGVAPEQLPAGVTEILSDPFIDGSGEGIFEGIVLRSRRTLTGATRTTLSIADLNQELPEPRPVLQRVSRTGAAITSATWSPDHSRIAFIADGDLFTVKPDGTGLQTIYNPPGRRVLGRISWQTTSAG